MTRYLIGTLLTLGAVNPWQVQLGSVRDVDVTSNENGTVQFRVTGDNPCGAVHFIYGDGNAITHPIVDVPVTIAYTYPRSGAYEVVVQGRGNCEGETTTRVQVTVPPELERARAEVDSPASDNRRRGRAAARERDDRAREIRFAGMDRNGNREIGRDEWSGNATSFRVHDWNGDDVLSGPEVEPFDDLDRNRDGYLSGTEWRGNPTAFDRLDRDGDFRLSRREAEGEPSGPAVDASRPSGEIITELRIPADVAWRDTGLFVRAGEIVVIRASGEIQWTARATDRANAEGSLAGLFTGGAPMPNVPAGALIGRVGQSAPFTVSLEHGLVEIPQSGRLFLGINDDNVSDNSGAFDVVIQIVR